MALPTEQTAAAVVDAAFRLLGRDRSTLIPVLQYVQTSLGYLPEEAITEAAKGLKVSASEVFGVITFYSQFRLSPPGEKTVKVCQGTACHVRGGRKILDEVEKTLDVKAGGTTSDRKYSVERIACFGACSLAPVMVVDDDVYGRLTPQKVQKLLRRGQ